MERSHSEGYIDKIIAIVNKSKVQKQSYQMAGNYDFLLKIVTMDSDSYRKFYLEKRSRAKLLLYLEGKNVTSIHFEL